MKRVAFAVCVVVLLFAVAISAQMPAQPKSESVQQELINLEYQWVDAVVKLDFAFLDRVLADDYIGINDGSVFAPTKAQYIEYVKSSKEEIISFVIDEWKVRVYGDAAVVMGSITMKMQSAGKEMTYQSRFTDTWVKRAGRWQCVAGHNSTIAQK
jgi:ketosteroid isomerase-like protein